MKEFKRRNFKGKNKEQKSSVLPKTRKDVRKARRKLKKVIKQEHVSKVKHNKLNRRVPGHSVDATSSAEAPVKVTEKTKSPRVKKTTVQFKNVVQEERNQDKKEQQQLVKDIESKRKDLLLKDNEEEELVIKKLEKQLGLNKMKTKNKTKSFAGDGLDYLLEICDRSSLEQSAAAEKYLAEMEENSDFDDDVAIATGQSTKTENSNQKIKLKEYQKKKCKSGADEVKGNELQLYHEPEDSDEDELNSSQEDSFNEQRIDYEADDFDEDESVIESDSSDDTHSDSNDSSDDEGNNLTEIYSKQTDQLTAAKRKSDTAEDNLISKKKKKITLKDANTQNSKGSEKNKKVETQKKSRMEEFVPSDSDDESEDDQSEGSDPEENRLSKCDENGIWEDIYGRKRDKKGNVLKEDTGKYIPPHLRKQSENVESEEIIQLKRQMKSVLNKLAGSNMHWACTQIEELYNSNSRNAVNSVLYDLWSSAVIQSTISPVRLVAEHAVLIAVLQANVGMEVGAHFLQTLVKWFNSILNENSTNSEDKKLENLISGLSYLYCFKIFHATLLFEILSRLMEETTEKHIECVLIALKNVGGILRKDEPLLLKTFIQETQTKTAQMSEQVATGTRVKFLMDVLLAIKNNNLSKIPNYDPSYSEELKKAMKAIVRRGNYVTPLNIKIDDLLKADEQGKWWVVGSAWSGSTLQSSGNSKEEGSSSSLSAGNTMTKKMQELARQQRMNTEARKNIFAIIMSAEDYMDAFEKLLHLGLKNQQERDIVYVIIACCLQEKKYNPYYAVLAQKFCEYDRKFQLSIQYSVWDKLKEINDFNSMQLVNLAQFLTHLITEKGLPLSVLKVVHFSELNKPTLRLMRQILLAILLNDCEDTCLEVFKRVAVSAKLHMFRESLRLFVRHFLLKNLTSKDIEMDPDKKTLLEQRADLVDKVLSSADLKVQF